MKSLQIILVVLSVFTSAILTRLCFGIDDTLHFVCAISFVFMPLFLACVMLRSLLSK